MGFLLGNGILKSTLNESNASGGTYIYMAFKDTREYAFWLDDSGNNNDWQPNGGITTSSTVTDTPTPYAGGGNYCVWNAVAQSTVVNGTVTRSNANLTSTDGGTTYGLESFGTIAVSSGKWYWETTLTSAGGIYANIGVVDLNSPLAAPSTHTGICYRQSNGYKDSGSSVYTGAGAGTSYGATYAAGDVIGTALDLDAGTITFYKNGVSQGVAYTGISGNYTPAVGDGQNATSYTFDLNCGQRPFAYTPPTGFKALHTGNLPDSTIVDGSQYFDVVTYAGTGVTTHAITSLDFPPSLVWIKARDIAQDHTIYDQVRGVRAQLESNLTAAEVVESAGNGLVSFDSNGFTLDGDTYTYGGTNSSGYNYVAWNWKANGTGVSNTDGSITSTVSANPTAGFSVVTYTGNGSTGTVGHSLGTAPSMMIFKQRNTTRDWIVYHSSLGAGYRVFLNLTDASGASTANFNNTEPTSSVFSIGATTATNDNGGSYVAYCFAEVEGYSKFGSYTGNGSADGPFVYTGFRPAFVMVKRTDTANNWNIIDSVRSPYNTVDDYLFPNLSNAEATNVAGYEVDFVSNGFKLKGTGTSINASGGTYIYMAFAETDFANALAR